MSCWLRRLRLPPRPAPSRPGLAFAPGNQAGPRRVAHFTTRSPRTGLSPRLSEPLPGETPGPQRLPRAPTHIRPLGRGHPCSPSSADLLEVRGPPARAPDERLAQPGRGPPPAPPYKGGLRRRPLPGATAQLSWDGTRGGKRPTQGHAIPFPGRHTEAARPPSPKPPCPASSWEAGRRQTAPSRLPRAKQSESGRKHSVSRDFLWAASPPPPPGTAAARSW